MVEIEKNGEVQNVKERYLQNFIDRGWTPTGSKKTKPAGKVVKAAAEVKPVEEEELPYEEWDINSEDWADSEEAAYLNQNKGE